MDISDLLNTYREFCGAFCISKCDSKCCKVGKLRFTEKYNFLGDALVMNNGFFELTLPCKMLNGSFCGVYDFRPQICKDFPLFQRGSTVLISSFCPATKDMGSLILKLNDLGIKYFIL